MKKIITFVLALCMCLPIAFACVGCGKKNVSGLYDANGKRVLTWSQFVKTFSHAFMYNGKMIVNNDYVDEYGGMTANSDSSVLSRAGIEGNLIIDGSVEEISDYAFAGCDSLYRVKILSGVKVLNKEPFANCRNLERVVIDSADAYECVYDYTFYGCSKLADIYVLKNADKKKVNDYLDDTSIWEKSDGEGKYKNYYRYKKIG